MSERAPTCVTHSEVDRFRPTRVQSAPMWGSRFPALSTVVISLACVACGGSTPPAEAPQALDPLEEPAAESAEAPPPAPAPSEPESEAESAPSASAAGQATPEPQFTEKMSVEEAIRAVPQGGERRNMDPETLAKPLQDLSIYDSCKPGNARVKMRVAVWDGRAVGVDVTTTPQNATLASCIDAKVRELSWDKKVKSLNTVEYQF